MNSQVDSTKEFIHAFIDDSLGSPPASMTEVGTNNIYAVASGENWYGDRSLKITGGGSINHNFIYGIPTNMPDGDYEVRGLFRFDTYNADRLGLTFRAWNDSGTHKAYSVLMYGGNSLRLSSYSGTTETTITTQASGITYSTDKWYWIKVQTSGTSIKATVWAIDSDEPAGWIIDTTSSTIDNTHTGIGVYGRIGSGNVCWADYLRAYKKPVLPHTYATQGSLSFDGVDGKIAVSDNDFDGLSTGTIEFFAKTSYSGAYQKLVFKDGAIDIGVTPDFGGGAKVFAEIGGVGNLGEIEDFDIADGAYHHFAFSWDGSYLRAYRDGVYKKRVSQSSTQNDNSNDLYIGRRNTTEPFNGLMNEFRISNTARYTTETSFDIQTEDFEDDANTLVLLHFNEGSGTTATDDTGNNDGTLSGGVSYSTDIPYQTTTKQRENVWHTWKETFLRWDGAVIKSDNRDIISEAQGYALMLAAQLDDQTTFDIVESFNYDILERRHDGQTLGDHMMQWIVDLEQHGLNPSDNSWATDGDIDRAKALLWAHARWGSGGTINYLSRALDIIQNIREDSSNTDNGNAYILPYEGLQGDSSYRLNPSYLDPAAFRLFALYNTGYSSFWLDAVDGTYDVLTKSTDNSGSLATTAGLPTEWLIYNSTTNDVESSTGDDEYGFNAFRVLYKIYWDYVFYGSTEASSWMSDQIDDFFHSEYDTNGDIDATYDHDGTNPSGYDLSYFYWAAYYTLLVGSQATASTVYSNELETRYSDDGEDAMYYSTGYYSSIWNFFGVLLDDGVFYNYGNYDVIEHTTDALLRASGSKTHTSDTYLRATQMTTHSTDTLLRKEVLVQHATDAYSHIGESRIWSSGFETATGEGTSGVNLTEWTLGYSTGQLIDGTIKHGGDYSMKFNGASLNQAIGHQFRASNDLGPFFVRFYIYITQAPNVDCGMFALDNSSSGSKVYIKMTTDRELELYDEDANLVGTSSALSLSNWHKVDVKFDATGSGGSHIIEGRLNGSVFGTKTDADISTGVCRIVLGIGTFVEGVNQGIWYVDDVAINADDYPGEGYIVHLNPNAAGDNTDFTTQGSASNYENINDEPPSDSTYNYSNTLGHIDDFNLENTPSALASGDSVVLVAPGVRFDGSSSSSVSGFKLRLKKASAGTIAYSDEITPTSTTNRTHSPTVPYNYNDIYYTDPDGGDWTKDSLDTAQLGYEITTANTNSARVSAMWLLVEYTSVSQTINHTTNTYLRKQSTVTHTTNALLRGKFTVDHDTDALLREQATTSHTTDALLREQFTITHTTDGLLRGTGSANHTIDTYLRGQYTKTHTTETLLRKQITTTHDTDTFLTGAFQLTHGTDTLLREEVETTHTTDILAHNLALLTHGTDTLLREENTIQSSTDALLRSEITETHTANSFLRGQYTKEHTSDALLRGTYAVEHSTDTLLRITGIIAFTTDTILRIQDTKTHSADGLLRGTSQVIYTTDTLLRKENTTIHSTDTVLRKESTQEHTADALLYAQVNKPHTTDTLLRGQYTQEHTTNIVLRGEGITTHETDATTHIAVTVEHNTDSYIRYGTERLSTVAGIIILDVPRAGSGAIVASSTLSSFNASVVDKAFNATAFVGGRGPFNATARIGAN